MNEPNANPGAGTYEIDRKVGEGPNFSMRTKDGLPKKDVTPAGTDYDPNFNLTREQQTAIGIGTAQRKPLNDPNANPAPGDYDYNQDAIRTTAPNRRFGTANRMAPNKKAEVPGAGQYEIETEFENNLRKGKGKTLAGRLKRPHSSYVPGPSAYNPSKEQTKKKAPQFSIGKAQRNRRDKEADGKPGPGQYDTNVDGIK